MAFTATTLNLNSDQGLNIITLNLFWRSNMRKIATLAVVSIVTLGALSASDAEARNGRRGAALAACAVGLAAGAIIAGTASQAYATPGYGYAAPVRAYTYDDGYYAAPAYTERRVVRYYEEPRPVYRTRRVVRTYDYGYVPGSTRTVTYSYGTPYYGSGYYGGW